jgi:hypothetical protein
MKKLIHGLILGSSLFSLEAAVLNFPNSSPISLNEPSWLLLPPATNLWTNSSDMAQGPGNAPAASCSDLEWYGDCL